MKSPEIVRHLILSRLCDHLQQCYGIEETREKFANGDVSLHEIDATLAFKSDPTLDELHGALERLEEGSYGICLGCKKEIGMELLEADPILRMCPVCEDRFSHAEPHGIATRMHA